MENRDGVRMVQASKSGPGSIPARCHIWVDFVGGSRLAPRVFSSLSDILSPQKTTNPNSTRIEEPHDNSILSKENKNTSYFIYFFNCYHVGT